MILRSMQLVFRQPPGWGAQLHGLLEGREQRDPEVCDLLAAEGADAQALSDQEGEAGRVQRRRPDRIPVDRDVVALVAVIAACLVERMMERRPKAIQLPHIPKPPAQRGVLDLLQGDDVGVLRAHATKTGKAGA